MREAGGLSEIVRSDNYRLIIPSALTLEDALEYLHELYKGSHLIFAAYYVEPLKR